MVLVRPDGRIFTAGDTVIWVVDHYFLLLLPTTSGLKDITLRQFNADGTADAAFVGGGKADLDVGADRSFGTALALQPDGKILATGCSRSGFFDAVGEIPVIARYNANGTRDHSFNGSGFIRASASKLAVGPDGKIAAGEFPRKLTTLSQV